LTLPAPGSAGSLAANKALVIDATAPTVSNVTSTLANGVYKAGTVVPIAVTFSEPVTVTGGTPTLTLETGATDRTATYDSGSGTTILIFKYTVQSGDASSDLDYASTTTLTPNGATIRNATAEDANLALPAPGTPRSLSSNQAIVIDAAAPNVVQVSSTLANGLTRPGRPS